MKKPTTAAVLTGVVALAGCGAPDSGQMIQARLGQSMEVDGIGVKIENAGTSGATTCWTVELTNNRWLRSVKTEDSGVVRAYAGVQDSIVYLAPSGESATESDYIWADEAPIKRGQSRKIKLCESGLLRPDRVHVDVAGSTIEFS